MEIKITTIAVGLILLITGCAPEPVFRLESQENDVMNYRGMEYLYSEGESSSVTMAYYRHLDDYIVMDVEVINYSDSVVQIDPENFTYNTRIDYYDGSYKPLTSGLAYNPEKILLDIDLESSRAEANERTNRLLDGLSATAYLVDEIAGTGSETTQERNLRETERTRRAIERAERRDNFYTRISSLNEQRSYWETQTIRKTDLYPEEALAGEILFPIEKDANVIEFVVRVAGEEHSFVYRQKKFQP